MLLFFSVRSDSATICILICIVNLFFTSCGQYMYSPAGGPLPDLKKQGDFHAQASLGMKNPSFGTSAAMQYAQTNHIGLSVTARVSGLLRFQKTFANQSYNVASSGYYTAVAAGCFGFTPNRFDEKKGIHTALWAGIGSGGCTARILGALSEYDIRDKARLRFIQTYIQPTAIIRQGLFDLGLSTRIGYISFKKGAFWGDQQMFRPTFQLFKAKQAFISIEPSIQIKTKTIKNWRFYAFVTATSMPVDIATSTLWGIGAQRRLNTRKKVQQPLQFPIDVPQPAHLPTRSRFSVCKKRNDTKRVGQVLPF